MMKRSYRTRISACSDIGDARNTNEDRIVVLERLLDETEVTLLAVADGCGGMSHGEVISQMIADSLRRYFDEMLPDLIRDQSFGSETAFSSLTAWLDEVNISARAFGSEIGEPVGSTLALLLIVDGKYYIVSAGDSRIYLLRRGRLEQLTVDQSKVSDMLRNHEITQEQAKSYAGRNALTMCVGFYEKLRLYTAHGKIKRNDIFLLCSDGFYRVIEDELPVILPRKVSYDSSRQLREIIPQGLARDNVSIIVAQMVPIMMGV